MVVRPSSQHSRCPTRAQPRIEDGGVRASHHLGPIGSLKRKGRRGGWNQRALWAYASVSSDLLAIVNLLNTTTPSRGRAQTSPCPQTPGQPEMTSLPVLRLRALHVMSSFHCHSQFSGRIFPTRGPSLRQEMAWVSPLVAPSPCRDAPSPVLHLASLFTSMPGA
jgi:hypothetical protein